MSNGFWCKNAKCIMMIILGNILFHFLSEQRIVENSEQDNVSAKGLKFYKADELACAIHQNVWAIHENPMG